jgi:hypothetical protein
VDGYTCCFSSHVLTTNKERKVSKMRDKESSFWLDDLLRPGDADVAEDGGDDRRREAAQYDLSAGEVPVEGVVPVRCVVRR